MIGLAFGLWEGGKKTDRKKNGFGTASPYLGRIWSPYMGILLISFYIYKIYFYSNIWIESPRVYECEQGGIREACGGACDIWFI